MLWKLLRVVLGTYYVFYFRRFKGKNLHQIRVNKPVLIAINHPNAFMDPIALSIMVFSPRTYYMARGDAFKKGFATMFLTSLGIVPIFRLRDGGIEGVKKNNASFSIVYKMWNKGKKIMVFPEGLCVQERRLRPIQKGTARMAFGFTEEFKRDDFLIVPVSVTYSHPSKIHTDIYYQAGEPIEVKDFIASYKENPAKGINELTRVIEEKMKAITPHLNDKENDLLLEQLQEIYKEQYLEENKLNKNNLDNHQQFWFYITNQLNLISENSKEQIEKLRNKTAEYIKKLNISNVHDVEVYNEIKGTSKNNFIIYCLLILGFPFYLIGKVLHFIPKYLAKKLSEKKGRELEFRASFNFGAGAIFSAFYFLIELLVIWFVFKIWWYLPAYFAIKLLFGYIGIKYSRFKKEAFYSIRFNNLKTSKPAAIEELKALRNEILTNLTVIKQ